MLFQNKDGDKGWNFFHIIGLNIYQNQYDTAKPRIVDVGTKQSIEM